MKLLNELNLPEKVKYDTDHEWVCKNAPFRIGISDFAQDQLGDLTFVELPLLGAELHKGEEFGTLESTKSVSPLLAPVSGHVKAINESLSEDPGLVNRDPYGEGWILEMELSDPAELDELMDTTAYKRHLQENS